MRKVAIIFIFAVIIPSGALAWLALRSMHDEQLILRARQAQLFQAVADSFAKQALSQIQERQRDFATIVENMLINVTVDEAANTFDPRISKEWPMARVGFSLNLDGAVLSPSLLGRAEGRNFRVQNDRFLCSKETIEVFVSTPKGSLNVKTLDEAEKMKKGKIPIAAEETDFRKIVGHENEGIVARFLENKLHVLMWYRSSRDQKTIFGAQLDLDKLARGFNPMMNDLDTSLQREICVAILDDAGLPMALSDQKFATDWRHPAASAPLGEILPHWEAAVYPLAPINYEKAASRSRWTLGLLIACMVAAIAMGSFLLLSDLRRQLVLAQQKSDFVSNVSHELKTPLTSIRMFSELLADDRVAEPEKRKNYLQIINAETARLTRLINNILDFARMEKGEQKYNFVECDLAKIVREAIENYRPQLEAHGFKLEHDIASQPHMVRGDCDALAQIILNLLSNAEKYSGEAKEVRIEFDRIKAKEIEIRVLDRGIGVPSECCEKIFEQFFRAHDSLSSGIQGSGLGLTLARQIARAHGGDVSYAPREGGGSIFALKLPALA
jgi:signal transduction histidine kinase